MASVRCAPALKTGIITDHVGSPRSVGGDRTRGGAPGIRAERELVIPTLHRHHEVGWWREARTWRPALSSVLGNSLPAGESRTIQRLDGGIPNSDGRRPGKRSHPTAAGPADEGSTRRGGRESRFSRRGYANARAFGCRRPNLFR